MYIYLIMLAISLFFAVNYRKNKKVYLVLACLPFLIIAAIRFDVGTDYLYRYVTDYLNVYEGNNVEYLETSFILLYRFCIMLCGRNFQLVFIITSLIIYSLIFLFVYKHSKNPALSILLFFITGFYFQSLNIVRQYVAIAIIVLGYDYLKDEKYFHWIIVCLLASLIHSSAIVCVIAVLLKKVNFSNVKVLGSIVILYCILDTFIGDIIRNIVEMTRFSVYFGSNYAESKVSMTLLLVNTVLYMFMLYSYKIALKRGEATEEDKILLDLQALTIIFTMLGNTILLFSRLVYYFQFFQIISIPRFLTYYKIKTNKIVFGLLIISLFFGLFVRSNIFNNYNEVVPYKTCFGREAMFYFD